MKLSKVFSIVTIAVMLLASVSNIVLAGQLKPDDITPSYGGTAQDSIKTIGGQIVGTIQTVGSVIAVVVLLVIGIKYMMGSAEEKAEYKKTMVPYVVGAVLIFAAVNIAGIIFDMTSGLGKAN